MRQRHYILSPLKYCNMLRCKPSTISMVLNLKLIVESVTKLIDLNNIRDL